MKNIKTYKQEDINYILELYTIQSSLFEEYAYDLHDIGELVTNVWKDEDLQDVFKNNLFYRYWTELFNETKLIEKIIKKYNNKLS